MPDKPLTFAAFAGSLRKGSYNRMLLNALLKLAPPKVTINVLDVSNIPLYNMDLDTSNPPESVKRLRENISKADGLIIVTPEHNYSMSGVTKTVIEWASRPPDKSSLDGKPAAVLGGSPGGFGTVRAQLHVRQMGLLEGLYFLQDPEIRVARIHTKFNEVGELIDEDLKKELIEFHEAFVRWTLKIKG